MDFSIEKSISILEKTPAVMHELLFDLPEEWVMFNEGGETWSPYDIVGHLIHGESSDWIKRLEKILSDFTDNKFTPFDRFAQVNESKGKEMNTLLNEFKILRTNNIKILKSKNITDVYFEREGVHPVFGIVSLRNLIATWVVHDFNHLAQITRVMAHQYKSEVGPWKEYLRILK